MTDAGGPRWAVHLPDYRRRVHGGYSDLGFARLDVDRAGRTGDPEVVYGAGKTVEQGVALVAALREAHPERAALVTRAGPELIAALRAAYGADLLADEDARGRRAGPAADRARDGLRGLRRDLGRRRSPPRRPSPRGSSAPASSGWSTSGVAGIHRLLAVRDVLDAADCLVVVAGMDGALPSAVGGLTGVPLVAVPTSVGYGASFGGVAALLAMLNSCAPGVAVCNIDNGFGAGVFAARVARRAAVAPDRP